MQNIFTNTTRGFFGLKHLVACLILLMIVNVDTNAQSATQANIGGTSSVRYISNNSATVIDTGITLTANGNITGFTVSITGSYTSGDVLGYNGTLPSGISAAAFNTATRSLVFSGTTTAANWQALMRTVTLTTTSAVCNPESRLISFVVGIKYYNILNGHFYEYYSTTTDWSSAKSYASNYSYFGREGYLATVTAQSENSFSYVLVGQNSWIGCSDNFSQINAAVGYTLYANQAAADGNFYWVTGPERGLKISSQNAWASGGAMPVAGVYSNWSSGEPNDYPGQSSGSPGEEDYGHMYTGSGLWNDFPNGQSIGSIIEFGGMPNDNTSSKVVFTRSVYINGAPSGTITGGNISVCSGTNSTALTLTGLTGTVVRWESSLDNFLTTGTSISNTTTTYTATNITTTTYYRAVVNTSSGCSSLGTSSTPVYVNTPTAGNIVAANNSICAGSSASFNLYGNSGSVVKWQMSTSSTFASSVTDISNTTASLSYTLASNGTYYFRAVVQISGCGSSVNTPGYTITVISGTPPVGGSVNSAEHCGGTNSGTITLSGYTGTVVKWQYSIDGGIIWTDVANTTASLSYSGITANRSYRAQLTNGSCGTTYSSSGSITVFGTTVSRWDGGTSNAWQLASNWCGGVADNGMDVVINSSSSNHLVLDQSRIIGNLNFNGANKYITLGNNNLITSGITGGSSNNFVKTTGTGSLKTTIANGSTVTFPVGYSTYNPVTITNNTGNSDIMSLRVFDRVYKQGSTGDTATTGHVRHTWDIGKTNPNGGSGLNFVFNWNSGEAYSISTPTLYHQDGGYWVKQTGATSSTSTSLTYTGYTGTFSPFGVGNSLISLPVTVIRFEAKAQPESRSTLLQWQTASEINTQHFAVQRSEDGLHWYTIGTVMAAGNSTQLNNYSFTDFNPGQINFYRLSQVDQNTLASLTNTVKVDFGSLNGNIIKVYPNPSKGSVNIETNEATTYSIIDINGRIIMEGQFIGFVQLNDLPTGLYMARITVNEEVKTIKLVIE